MKLKTVLCRHRVMAWFRRMRSKWPLVGQDERLHLLRLLASERKEHEVEIRRLTADLDRIVPSLVKVSLRRDRRTETFRVVLELEPYIIRDCLMQGNDDWMLRAISDRIGHMAYRELKTANWQRFEDYKPTVPRFGVI